MILKDILQLPSFREAVVIAGKEGLERKVRSVNMMDAPDIVEFLKPDELLLTTAYAMKDQPEALEALVNNMAKQGCAALGIKTKRFWGEIPGQVLELAEQLAFPIIELPLEHALGELLSEALSHILEKRTEELRYALSTHNDFTQLVLSGKGLSAILDALSRLVNCPVLLLDNRMEQLTFAQPPDSSIRDHLVDRVRVTVELLHGSPLSQTSFCLLGIEEPWRDVIVYSIGTNQRLGYLLMFSPGIKEDSLQILAAEQATNVIGFEIMKHVAVKERSRRFKNDFFSDLVEGLVKSEQELFNRGKNYGLLPQSTCQCIVAKTDMPRISGGSTSLVTEDRIQKERDILYNHLKREFKKADFPFILFNKNDLFVIILTSAPSSLESEKKLLRHLEEIQTELLRGMNYALSFGVGKPAERLMDIPSAYEEAIDALQSGYSANESLFIRTYRTKDTLDLLKLIPRSEVEAFFSDTFHRLLEIDPKERQDLMQTLHIYLEHQGQIAETAKRMFLHRNTVIYRLEKCERLMRRNLKDPEETMRLRLAFRFEVLLAEM